MSNFFPTGDNVTNQNFSRIEKQIQAGVAPVQAQVNRVSSSVTNIAGAISSYYATNSYVNNSWPNHSSYVNNYWNGTTLYMVSPLQQLQAHGMDELFKMVELLERIYLTLVYATHIEISTEEVYEDAGSDASLLRAALTKIALQLERMVA
jgi:hypothetical protein